MKHATLLVVDDNRNILTTVRMLLSSVFERVVTLASPVGIPARLREDKPDVVLLDMNFKSGINTGNEGIFWLHEIKRLSPHTEVVLFTAYADIELAVRGMKEGAHDFIVKPFDNEKLVSTLLACLPKGRKVQAPQDGSAATPTDGHAAQGAMYWGESPVMRDLRMMVEKVAPTDANILITGENGTGKEVLAAEIHRLSSRSKTQGAGQRRETFFPIDMGAISETLFESELFGHVKGAFTDAKADKPGKLELATGGTLFLDEIGNLSYGLQAKLLTALQRRSIVRVGGAKPIPIDVRLLCATNKDLQQMVNDGLFREDLLYRINTIHLHLPPLRERKGDIAPLASHFLHRYADLYGRQGLSLSPEAAERVEQMPWPGNIRELQHAMERAVILCEGDTVMPRDLPSVPTAHHAEAVEQPTTLDGMERQLIAKTIDDCQGNLSQVAAQLGISRQTLYNKIKKYGL
ncbi:MAG TPA: sigma-54-dependent Fis family transcriptional regulator [Prevotella sp.]|nr:sigma-54-dependent Fis family transcriptional regulator [Prevotella sp.]